jgi:hypothetical protein
MIGKSMTKQRYWSIAYMLLFAAFIATGLLNMMRVRAGFITNYVADIAVPAYLYIVFRGLHEPAYRTPLTKYLGRRPEITALVVLGGSIATEICQHYWPKGLFAGRYDPYDIVAYGVGVGICYVFDKRFSVQTGLKSAAR